MLYNYFFEMSFCLLVSPLLSEGDGGGSPIFFIIKIRVDSCYPCSKNLKGASLKKRFVRFVKFVFKKNMGACLFIQN